MCHSLYILIMQKPNYIHFNHFFLTKIYIKYMTNFYGTFSFKPPMKQIRYMHNSHIKLCRSNNFPFLETLEETAVSIRNRFPQNDQVSHIQKDLDFLTIIFRSVLDQFSLVDDPNTLQLLILSHIHQYYFKNYYIFQTIPAISKYKILSNYLLSLEPFH